ncbi:MAG: TonB family protein [Polyangiales bacterium]
MYVDDADPERPESLLRGRPVPASVVSLGFLSTLGAHLLIPIAVLGSQWLLVLLGLAIPPEERERPKQLQEVMAAEFVKLGKPFDPTKLPQRKVPPIAKRKPDGVVVSKDAKEQPEPKEEKKEKQKDTQASLLDNLVDRTKDFAEDVKTEEQGDPDGIQGGTAETAKLGNIYLGKLSVFFRRGWSVPNVVQNREGMSAMAAVKVGEDGRVESVEIDKSSGDPLFDQSILDRITELINAGEHIPEPPPEIAGQYYGQTLTTRFRGSDAQ